MSNCKHFLAFPSPSPRDRASLDTIWENASNEREGEVVGGALIDIAPGGKGFVKKPIDARARDGTIKGIKGRQRVINGETIKDIARRRVARQRTTRAITTKGVLQNDGQSAEAKTGPNRLQNTADTSRSCSGTFVNNGAGLLLALPKRIVSKGCPKGRRARSVLDRSRKSGGCCGDSECEESEGLVRVHV